MRRVLSVAVMTASLGAGVAGVVAAAILQAQSAPLPSFEVVSIKRSAPGQQGQRIGTQRGGRWIMTNSMIAAKR